MPRPIEPPAEARQQARTHLFVAATLCADGVSTAVHIRNMSASGALIEGAVLPDVGYRVSLKRGPLQATGHIAWRTDRRAGVRLEAPVCIPDWMARQINSGQARVDAILSVIRSADSDAGVPAPGDGPASIEAELGQLRRELAELGNVLSRDVAVIAAHPEIQVLDVAVQRIDRILERLRSGG